MAFSLIITLTSAGVDSGPVFDIYSDVDGFVTPFEINIPKATLLAGYLSINVPDGTTQLKMVSDGVLCTNDVIFQLPIPACLNTNGTFDTDLSGWTQNNPGNWDWTSANGGAAEYNGSDEGGLLCQDILTIGQTYVITFDVFIEPSCITSPLNTTYAYVYAGTTQSVRLESPGWNTVTLTLTCAGNTNFCLQGYSECGTLPYIMFDNVCVTAAVLSPQRCTAIGSGPLGVNSGYNMEKDWNDDQLPNPPDGIYSFEIMELKLNGVSYGVGSTITITAPVDLVVGPGIFGGTYVQNINDWLNSIPGVAGSGFVFYDDMSTVDTPYTNSTYSVTIKRTTVRTGDTFYYKWEKDIFGTAGYDYHGSFPVDGLCSYGCWMCSNL